MNRPQTALVGLSDFSISLISGLFDALASATVAQSERMAEIDAMLALSEEAFKQTYITDVMVDDRLLALFGPAQKKGNTTAVDAGEPYQPASKTQAELPAVKRAAGIVFDKEDIKREGRRITISVVGCKKIRNCIAVIMTKEAIGRLVALKKRGIPRIEVERGKVNVKMIMKFEESTPGNAGDNALKYGIRVATISLSDPSMFRYKSGIASELELHFKTVQQEK
jgi:hypothetical protein